MKPASLQKVMNRMARRSQPVSYSKYAAQAKRQCLTAPEAFMHLDPLLTDLHKHYLNAKIHHEELAHKYGADDPMADVAADMADSALCAFETRLIEVRMDQGLRRAAAKLLRKDRRLARQEMLLISRLYRKKQNEFFSYMERRENLRRKAEENFSMTMFLYWMLYFALQATRRALSLANDFSAASAFNPAPEQETQTA